MRRAGAIIAVALAAALLPALGSAHSSGPAVRLDETAPRNAAPADAVAARLLEGMGNYRLEISTRAPLAQRFFDQGLVLAWGFNFAEAERSFREAARLDPECAVCWWGAAYALGPSINHDMDAAAASAAYRHIQRANQLTPHASVKERALIQALKKRYGAVPLTDRAKLDAAYAREVREVARRFPDDADVLTLLADALMIPHGRDYWRKAGSARPWTPEILKLLERALELAPDHPGANHFYVHVLEDSPYPERARASAQRLQTLAPGVAHLVHMPAHVLLRLGDYAGASLANQNAIAADRAYLRARDADPRYAAGYVEHNHHFLWYTSIMSGNSNVALAAASELMRYAESIATGGSATGTQQHFLVLPLYAQVRFGRWQAIIAAPRPAQATAYTTGVWHYARGMAYLRTGQPDRAREELESLNANLRSAARDTAALKNLIPLSRLLAIATRLLQAELAAAAGNFAGAYEQSRAAVRIESGLDADEPPAWHMPARHTLGALLLEAGRVTEAERVYREDLKAHPENGWSLVGLAESLARQGRASAAAEARTRFERAWTTADVVLSGSRF
jgi:tetratricopeptide (TPR) repeat protein